MKMTIEQFESGIKQGTKILLRWINCEGINASDVTNELRNAGFGETLVTKAFDIAVNSEGYEDLIECGLRKLLAEWKPA
jgi:hypothetical protein